MFSTLRYLSAKTLRSSPSIKVLVLRTEVSFLKDRNRYKYYGAFKFLSGNHALENSVELLLDERKRTEHLWGRSMLNNGRPAEMMMMIIPQDLNLRKHHQISHIKQHVTEIWQHLSTALLVEEVEKEL